MIDHTRKLGYHNASLEARKVSLERRNRALNVELRSLTLEKSELRVENTELREEIEEEHPGEEYWKDRCELTEQGWTDESNECQRERNHLQTMVRNLTIAKNDAETARAATDAAYVRYSQRMQAKFLVVEEILNEATGGNGASLIENWPEFKAGVFN